jgi:hypothetical protein
LEETEKLKGLALLRVNLVDTLDANNEGKLGLLWDIKGTFGLGHTSQANLLALSIAILLDVLLSTLEDCLTLLLVGL